MPDYVAVVFSLSSKDPSFEPNNIEKAVQWLRAKHEQPYLFRERRPRFFRSGFNVLFSFEGQIFGQATAKEDISDLTGDADYKYSTVFEDDAEIFSKPYKRKKDLKHILLPERKDFGQLFTYLTQDKYQRILRQVRK
jgi:hypothetical protein